MPTMNFPNPIKLFKFVTDGKQLISLGLVGVSVGIDVADLFNKADGDVHAWQRTKPSPEMLR